MLSTWLFAAGITVHCLIGCVIGEIIGLSIGVTMQLHPVATMALATILAFITGMLLATTSVVRNKRTTYMLAIRIVWLGEVVSISVMEIVMNGVDYYIGGVGAQSITDPIFWKGLLFAIPAGYFAALPVNYYLIKKNLKKCH
ncbi:MAG: hypothetical protein COA94_01310 [Rickettsiales bacterium]|nr:MAG: hypothetical protein COA94_01310 [Rickettsiales bacterium]